MGSFGGYSHDRFYAISDGSKWQQVDAHYEWRFAHKPAVIIEGEQLTVEGMKRSVKVRRIK
jgi:hypothetical protein